MNTDLISVVLSAFNADRYIMKCINSVLSQTYQRFELIIIDDGSVDSTPMLIDKVSERDKRVICVHKNNEGLSMARKTGYMFSSGGFICFIDSDDYLESDYLENLHSKMNQNTDIVIGSYYIDQNEIIREKRFGEEHFKPEEYVAKFILPSISYIKKYDSVQYPDFVWLRMYRKSIISSKCFVSERLCYTEDMFFQFEALKNAVGVAVSNKPSYHYVVTKQSLTQQYRSNKKEMVLNRLRIVREYCDENRIPMTEERLIGLEYTSMMGCIYNARLPNDPRQFIIECKAIKSSFSKCLQRNTQKYIPFPSKKQRLVYLLFRWGFFSAIYYIIGIK